MSEPGLRSFPHPTRKRGRSSVKRIVSYFQKKSFLKVAIAGFLCLTVPFHQIPNRRFLMQALWHHGETARSSIGRQPASSVQIKKIPRIFQRCRPCVVQKREKFIPPVSLSSLPGLLLTLPYLQFSSLSAFVFTPRIFFFPASPSGRSPPSPL